MEAYLHGVSTREVDDRVKALGADSGISKSEVSRICADLDSEVAAFRDRPLAEIAFHYVFLDATYCKARINRQRRVAGGGHRHRGRGRRAPRGPRLQRRRQRGRRVLDRLSALAQEWQVSDRRYLSDSSIALLQPSPNSPRSGAASPDRVIVQPAEGPRSYTA